MAVSAAAFSPSPGVSAFQAANPTSRIAGLGEGLRALMSLRRPSPLTTAAATPTFRPAVPMPAIEGPSAGDRIGAAAANAVTQAGMRTAGQGLWSLSRGPVNAVLEQVREFTAPAVNAISGGLDSISSVFPLAANPDRLGQAGVEALNWSAGAPSIGAEGLPATGIASTAAGAASLAGLTAIPGAILQAALNPQREGGENTARGVGMVGGAAGGAALGSTVFPGVGTALGAILGGVLGSEGGGLLHSLLGGKSPLAVRQAKEKALQRHLAAGAVDHMRNVAADEFQTPDILRYLESSDNLSNQGFAGAGTADFRTATWDRMIDTLLKADPVKYGRGILLQKFHPDIVRGYEDEIGHFTAPASGDERPIEMAWEPTTKTWIAAPNIVRDAGGLYGLLLPDGGTRWLGANPTATEILEGSPDLVYDARGQRGLRVPDGVRWLT